ncbi:MAG: tetratricopeptide repeat protein [Bryobacteraceae bacterium]|nr:tetratricopeptide repeat protein [Bryobacteraceae bacterium]
MGRRPPRFMGQESAVVRVCPPALLILAVAAALIAQSPEALLKSLIEEARLAEQKEDLDAAVQAYRRILQLRPDWASAEFNLALVYHSQHKYRDAIAMLEQALRHNPALEDAHLFLGSSHFHIAQYPQALAALERFAALQPGSPEALPLLADTHFRLGNFERAAEKYLARIRIAPEQPEPYYYLRESYLALAGASLRELNETPDAAYYNDLFAAEELASAAASESALRALIGRRPDLPEAYIALGAMKLRQGDKAEADAAFRSAVERDPAAGSFLVAVRTAAPSTGACPAGAGPLVRAVCLVSRGGNDDEAAKAVLALPQLPGRQPREVYWTMRLFSRLAEQTVQRLAANAPQSAVLAIIRARIFEQAGDLVQAEAEYTKALASRQDPESLIEYGKFKCRISDFDAAIGLFEKALALDAGRADVHGLMGEVYMIQGDAAKALPHARTAVQGDPAGVQARLYLAQALQKLSRTPEAIKVLEAAPSDPDGRVHYLLARYLAQQGRKEEANRALAVFKEKRKSGERPSPLGSLTGAAVPEP